jgi:crotonobetainyl-CoA:carnitine CoA-transferase CaiB-like acyl-CoA transferase
MASFGPGAAELLEQNPSLIYCSINGTDRTARLRSSRPTTT